MVGRSINHKGIICLTLSPVNICFLRRFFGEHGLRELISPLTVFPLKAMSRLKVASSVTAPLVMEKNCARQGESPLADHLLFKIRAFLGKTIGENRPQPTGKSFRKYLRPDRGRYCSGLALLF